ncbi:MalY/PatB family protein [Sutcliffiella cohnii]|uniref:MalY/PatB family protein n=1 Tax=Sutcliffiella cohnii TaxID=33932 RepID=UPI002E216C55|nr:pyridoxal phosphate-dependent aminotransferase [Sutcliffiella cohnii]
MENFKEVNRKNTASVKWDYTKEVFGVDDCLPMWVADMDFPAPRAVTDAIIKRAEHGVYGYTSVPPTVTEAIQSWYSTNYQWHFNSNTVTYLSGVVPALSAIIQSLSEKDESVLTFSPVYYPFFNMIQLNNRQLVTSPLLFENGRYYIDFEDLEKKLKSSVKLLLLCNPHNPGGTVWTKEELNKIGELCVKYDVIVVSDEIHGDLALFGNIYTPFASISEQFSHQSIICIAPTKTFNIAGLQAAAIISHDDTKKRKIDAFLERQGHFTINTFGMIGMEAAYRSGAIWLSHVKKLIENNVETAFSFIQEQVPDVTAFKPEGTYLIWIDCRKLQLNEDQLKDALLHKGKLALDFGKKFGPEAEGFVRMNVACSKETLNEGLKRLKLALTNE